MYKARAFIGAGTTIFGIIVIVALTYLGYLPGEVEDVALFGSILGASAIIFACIYTMTDQDG